MPDGAVHACLIFAEIAPSPRFLASDAFKLVILLIVLALTFRSLIHFVLIFV